MPKRPLSRYSSSDSDEDQKRRHIQPGILSGVTLHFIQAQIDPAELDQFYSLADSHGADIRSNAEHAEVILTRISTRGELERFVGWELAKQKAVVSPTWMTESIARKERLPYRDYVAVPSLEEYAVEEYHAGHQAPLPSSSSDLSYMSRYAVQRASPLICPNQALLAQLAVIRDARAHDGDERSAMSYSRSMAAIKAYTSPIKSPEQVSHLPFLGPKILTMIREYITSGHISETTRLSKSTRYRSLAEFTRIHGIGPQTARKLYDEGCRTLHDLDRRFGAEPGQTEASSVMQPGETAGVRTMLELRDDLTTTIPRVEVEEITRTILQELEELEPGCMHTICGGYRRGKLQCNDVDIVFTHPRKGKDIGLCEKLLDRLLKKKLVTHVLHHSSFRSSNPVNAPHGASRPNHPNWDTLDKSLVVFRLPAGDEDDSPRLHRRVDLICAPIELYWTAVVGWTGSTMFERDLRLWAKQQKGLKFDSAGITRRRDTKLLLAASEREVFEILGLEWVEPTLRNADL